ncbi:hypothetical protein OBV_14600 [Oscillibacter valericigenes Sjm18-20]|nr:hypothetical protein OBV_14600 [Oscillibacter valericigenes Sjm18-20]
MLKRINSQACLEFICFSFFAVLLFYLTASRRYLSYVTPKMAPYLYFTSAVMLVWAVSKFPGIFRPQHRTRAAHCLILVIPILFLLLPHSSVITSGMSSGYLGGSSLTNASGNTSSASVKAYEAAAPQSNSSVTSDSSVNADTSNEDMSVSSAPAAMSSDNGADTAGGSGTDGQQGDSIKKQYGLKLSEDGSINVSDDLFYPWMSEIYSNLKQYDGTTITIKGFVYKDSETMKSNEFAPARLLMWCCSADLSPCGIICEYDKASELEEDTWVEVTGVIHIGKYQGEDEPQITVAHISSADKPKEEYVYPW